MMRRAVALQVARRGTTVAGLLLALAAVLLLALGLLWHLGVGPMDEPDDLSAPAPAATPALVARGALLARAANCAGCHTARGGEPYAGGRAIATPFGTVYPGNLTPDAGALGGWSAVDFRRALHLGRSRDGRLLVPAFPYPHFTQIPREDVDALFLYLKTVAPVARPDTPQALRFPFNTQLALAAWRSLYFRPGRMPPEPARSAEWQRGAYLVNALGHCAACHGARNLLGASAGLADGHGGAPLPREPWYAPSLADPAEAGLAGWPVDEAVALLKTGSTARAVVLGPMAEVVAQSTQHLDEADLRAMVVYLQSLPAPAAAGARTTAPRDPLVMARGGELYRQHCADCHGAQGQGAPGVYPALVGNRVVTMTRPANLLLAVTRGGFAPGTAANPRPYGMPPFDLPDEDLAALLTWLRGSWGHDAAPVSPVDVLIAR